MTAKPGTAYIALGTNLGNRAVNLNNAIERLGSLGKVAGVSSVYETAPWDVDEPQPAYLNQVVRLVTPLEPETLMAALLDIEDSMGRVRGRRNAPRVIDLDLLLYDDRVITSPGLVVPHPRMTQRAFVMTPLAEIAPELKVPGEVRRAREIAASLGASGVRRLEWPDHRHIQGI